MTARKNYHVLKTGESRAEMDENPEAVADSKAGHQSHKNGGPSTGRNGLAVGDIKSQLNILIVLGVVAFLYFARSVVLPVLLAGVGTMVLKPVMKWLSRRGLPKFLSALMILSVLMGVVGFGFVELSQPAVKWIRDAPGDMARLRQRANQLLPTDKIGAAVDSVSQLSAMSSTNGALEVQVKQSASAGKAINWTAGLFAGVIETIVLLYMFLVSGDALLNQILDGNELREKRQALSIGHEVQETISNYLLTVSLINICLGTVVGVGLYFFGVPNAALWGLMAACLNYIPYFGPIVGIIIVGFVSFLTIDSLPQNLLPAAWYLGLHLAEADYITPVLLGRRFTISPLVVFISLLFGIWLWGIVGAILSVPLLISLKVLCQRIPSLAPGNRFL
jgi:predicted PurR-regulated permease PerM